MSRGNQFFLGVACCATLAYFPTPISASTPPAVVVIGAGLSGLTAAHRLQKSGVEVEVYEANTRPGGRVYTFYFDDGSYEELGGSNFSDAQDHEELLALVKEMGLELDLKPSFGMQKAFCQFPQMELSSLQSLFRDAQEPQKELLDQAREWMNQVNSLAELHQKMFDCSPDLQRFFHYFYSCYEGSSPECLTPHYLSISLWDFYRHFWAISQEIYVGPVQFKKSVFGGNSRLIDRLVDSLSIHYDAILQKIERGNERRFRLTFTGRAPVEANYVILTLPCTTLREVEVEAGLIPQEQWQAIETLQYATHAKIVVPIATEQSHVSLFNEKFTTWTNQKGLLTFYQYGQAGVFDTTSMTAVEGIVEKNLELVKTVYSDLERKGAREPVLVRGQKEGVLAPVAISWVNEPFAKGSYSNFGVEKTPSFIERKRIYKTLGEEVLYLFRPVQDGLFFAGEHTALVDFATLGGAVQSGERAARMVYRALEKAEEIRFQEYLEAK